MEALAELSDQLGNPGAQKLYLEARRRKIPVSRAQVQDLVKRQGQRQLFQPVQPSKGQSAAEGYSARYQADLADMSTTPSKGCRFFLFLSTSSRARRGPLRCTPRRQWSWRRRCASCSRACRSRRR